MADFNNNTVYILDSYGLIYRYYYAFITRPLTNAQGQNVSALYGFFKNIHSILKHYNPTYIAAAMDSKTKTFRHEMFPEYKANRPKTPEDLHAQIPWICDVLKSLNIPILQCDGYEADDIIATVATQCQKEGRTCRILSGDKDLMQLVCDTTQILKPDHADVWKVVNAEGVKAEWGVMPESMLDLLSLYGDSADNVPGVKGCGVKTACKLLEEYGNLENIYEHANEIKGAIGQKIRDGKENAFFSKKLIKLFTQVPCPEIDIKNFTSLEYNFKACADELAKYQIPAISKLYTELAFNNNPQSLQQSPTENNSALNNQNINKSQEKNATTKKELSEQDIQNLKQKMIPLHKLEGIYKVIYSVSELESAIESILNSKKQIAISTQVLDESNYESELLAISIALDESNAFYISFCEGEDLFSTSSISIADTIKYIQKLFDKNDLKLIFHDMKFSYKVLRHNGLKPIQSNYSIIEQTYKKENFIQQNYKDTMIAAWLLDSDVQGANPYALEKICQKYLAILQTELNELISKDQTFKTIPEKDACNFVCQKSCITFALWNELEKLIKKYYKEKLFEQLEIPLIPILAEMELTGIHLNTNELNSYNTELTQQIENLEKEIFALVGHSFNIASTKQLQEVLFTERGLKPSKKNKTGFSTDTSVLEELAMYDDVPKKILEYRELAKLKSTYVEALPKLCDKNSLIHTTFVQTGTATGRLSCKDPNLQNIPVRSEQGRKIRSSFTSNQNKVFISADYSQIELVVMAHLSKDLKMCKAFNEGTDVHKLTASLIYKIPSDQVTNEMRRVAKTINFGVIYGMSAFRLSNQLGISRTQAQEFISNYFTQYSDIQNFITQTILNAHETKSVSTIFGRTRYIPAINNSNKVEQAAAERIAVNTPIQGTAADIVKIAMLKINQALKEQLPEVKLLLQVHDELFFECPDNEETIQKAIELIKSNMENAVKLSIPLRVSIEYGKNWGQFH